MNAINAVPEQFWGMMLIVGSIWVVLALLCSFIYHRLDKVLEGIEPGRGETFEESDERWKFVMKRRDEIRVAGLTCLYGSYVIIAVALLGMGIQMVTR